MLQTMALYGAPLAGVALLGPEAMAAAGLAGAYDYMGDLYSYKTGLSTDAPNFTKSYITGVIGGLSYPFTIADGAIAGMSTAGKIAATGYNSVVAGTAAFGTAGVTHQDSPDASGAAASIATAAGSWAKTVLPAPFGNALNQMIQGAAGPLQNAIQNALKH